jgi:hypothetical protein
LHERSRPSVSNPVLVSLMQFIGILTKQCAHKEAGYPVEPMHHSKEVSSFPVFLRCATTSCSNSTSITGDDFCDSESSLVENSKMNGLYFASPLTMTLDGPENPILSPTSSFHATLVGIRLPLQ